MPMHPVRAVDVDLRTGQALFDQVADQAGVQNAATLKG